MRTTNNNQPFWCLLISNIPFRAGKQALIGSVKIMKMNYLIIKPIFDKIWFLVKGSEKSLPLNCLTSF